MTQYACRISFYTTFTFFFLYFTFWFHHNFSLSFFLFFTLCNLSLKLKCWFLTKFCAGNVLRYKYRIYLNFSWLSFFPFFLWCFIIHNWNGQWKGKAPILRFFFVIYSSMNVLSIIISVAFRIWSMFRANSIPSDEFLL